MKNIVCEKMKSLHRRNGATLTGWVGPLAGLPGVKT